MNIAHKRTYDESRKNAAKRITLNFGFHSNSFRLSKAPRACIYTKPTKQHGKGHIWFAGYTYTVGELKPD